MRQLWTWCLEHPLLAYLAGSAILSTLWYRLRGAVWPGRETERLPLAGRVLQALVETACNAPGAVRAALGQGGTPPGTPPARPSTLPPPPAALVLVALVGLGGVLAGCPHWERPACEAPGRYRCVGDRPEYCAPSRHWTPAGDTTCGPREACSLRADGVARCAPLATDGGGR